MKPIHRILLATAAGFCTLFIAVQTTIHGSGGWAAIPDLLRALAMLPFGVLIILAWPVACFATGLIAGGIAYWLLGLLKPAPIARNVEDAVSIALGQFRSGSAIRIRCPKCSGSLNAARVLSEHGVPDIRIACACGDCSSVHPFQPSRG